MNPVIGVTGALGSGKSAVARLLAENGARVVDMDEAGRWVVDHDPEVRRKLAEAFGDDIFDENGQLRRRTLGERVFGDGAALDRLNAAVHPAMVRRARQWLAEAQQAPACCTVVDAALLYELGFDAFCDRVLLVEAPLDLCLQRAEQFKGLTREQALRRLAAQWPVEEKRLRADFVIVNDGSLQQLRKKVEHLLVELTSGDERKDEGA